MSKAVLIMDMPMNCLECKLRHAHTCSYTNEDVLRYYEMSFRPGWCPLKEMEDKTDNWIPCSEGLPEIGTEVIVTTSSGYVWSEMYYDYKYPDDKEPCFHRWDSEMWQCSCSDVIAWQPLPERYEPKGD